MENNMNLQESIRNDLNMINEVNDMTVKTQIRNLKSKAEGRRHNAKFRKPKVECRMPKIEIRRPKSKSRKPEAESRTAKTEWLPGGWLAGCWLAEWLAGWLACWLAGRRLFRRFKSPPPTTTPSPKLPITQRVALSVYIYI